MNETSNIEKIKQLKTILLKEKTNKQISQDLSLGASEKMFELEFKFKSKHSKNEKYPLTKKDFSSLLNNKNEEGKVKTSLNNSIDLQNTSINSLYRENSNLSSLKQKILNEKFNMIPNAKIDLYQKTNSSEISSTKSSNTKDSYCNKYLNKQEPSQFSYTKFTNEFKANQQDRFYHKLMSNLDLNDKQIISEKYKEKLMSM